MYRLGTALRRCSVVAVRVLRGAPRPPARGAAAAEARAQRAASHRMGANPLQESCSLLTNFDSFSFTPGDTRSHEHDRSTGDAEEVPRRREVDYVYDATRY